MCHGWNRVRRRTPNSCQGFKNEVDWAKPNGSGLTSNDQLPSEVVAWKFSINKLFLKMFCKIHRENMPKSLFNKVGGQ